MSSVKVPYALPTATAKVSRKINSNSAMKIGIYGNNLNQGYWLARGLKRLGFEVKLFVPNYLFGQATFGWWLDVPPSPDLVFETGTSDMDLRTLAPLSAVEKIRAAYDEAKTCDLLVMSEDGPAFFSELEGVKKIFRSTGADIQLIPYWLRHNWSWSDWSSAVNRAFRTTPPWLHGIRREIGTTIGNYRQHHAYQARQRAGLAQCDGIICGPDQTRLLRKLSLTRCPVYHLPLPMDTDGLAAIDDDFATEIGERYRDCDLIFFHPSRQMPIRSRGNPYTKRNDRLIKGFARYLQGAQGRVKLVMIEKGAPDAVDASKALIERLGIESHIDWVEEMPFRRLAAFYRLSQCVVCVQVSKHSPWLSNIGREASYFGRMVITSFGAHHRLLYGDDLPPHVLAAFTAGQVFDAMRTVEEMTPAQRRERGREGKAWFMRQHSPERALPRFVEVFETVCG